MIEQSGVRSRSNPAEQNQVKIVVIGNDLEIIAGLNLAAVPNRLWDYDLSAFANVGRHRV
jgi:hypothetical protein